jgi:hypothetical protein
MHPTLLKPLQIEKLASHLGKISTNMSRISKVLKKIPTDAAHKYKDVLNELGKHFMRDFLSQYERVRILGSYEKDFFDKQISPKLTDIFKTSIKVIFSPFLKVSSDNIHRRDYASYMSVTTQFLKARLSSLFSVVYDDQGYKLYVQAINDFYAHCLWDQYQDMIDDNRSAHIPQEVRSFIIETAYSVSSFLDQA